MAVPSTTNIVSGVCAGVDKVDMVAWRSLLVLDFMGKKSESKQFTISYCLETV